MLGTHTSGYLLHVHNLWALGGFSVDTLRSTLLNYHIAQWLWLLMLKEDLAFNQSHIWMNVWIFSHSFILTMCINTYTSSLAHQQSPLAHATAGHYLIVATQGFTCAAMFAVPWALCSELSTWLSHRPWSSSSWKHKHRLKMQQSHKPETGHLHDRKAQWMDSSVFCRTSIHNIKCITHHFPSKWLGVLPLASVILVMFDSRSAVPSWEMNTREGVRWRPENAADKKTYARNWGYVNEHNVPHWRLGTQ